MSFNCGSAARQGPGGFILLESLVALFILAVVFLALEGSWTIIARTLTLAERESDAAAIARARRERIIAGPCIATSGTDSLGGVLVDWEAIPDSGSVRIRQTSRFRSTYGSRVVSYEARVACAR